MAKNFEMNGIRLSKASLKEGDDIALTYTGLLASRGATMVYAHVGYGDKWDERGFIPMNRTESGFTASFTVLKAGTLNLCFKDIAENWDNNSGENYIFPVGRKSVRGADKAPAEATEEKKKKATTRAGKSTEPAAKASVGRPGRKKKEDIK